MLAIPTPVHHDIIQRADLQPSTKLQYRREIDKLISNRVDPTNREELAKYAAELPLSSRSFLKAALRLLFTNYQSNLKSVANKTNIDEIQATLLNIDAMFDAIQVHREKGSKAHTWLSREQVEQITALPDHSTKGKRDYIVLAMLVGAGLRRDELANLTFTSVKQQPSKSGMRDVLEVTGKGNKTRVIPISQKLAKHLKDWKLIAGDGYIARAVNKVGTINGSLSVVGINNIIEKYGAAIGVPELDCHDLRRTYARIGYDSGVPVEQISKLLGHADLKTTMLYLGISIDLDETISDFIPLA